MEKTCLELLREFVAALQGMRRFLMIVSNVAPFVSTCREERLDFTEEYDLWVPHNLRELLNLLM